MNLLIKPAGGGCNLHCDYCFYMDEMENRETALTGMMSLDTIQTITKKAVLNAREPITFAFQGGEPTLRGIDFFRAVINYQKQYNHNHVPIANAIQTNGTLLNETWCRFFAENHFLVGISVDGTPQTHNRFRHTQTMEDTFESVDEKIALLEQFHVEYNILTVVTEQTAQHIEEIYRFYREKGWRYQQYIPCLDPLGSPIGTTPWSLTPKTYGEMLVKLFNLFEEDYKKHRQPYIRQFENWFGICLGYTPEACDQRGVCSKQYAVEANGDVYPCDFFMLDENRLGNITHDNWQALDAKRNAMHFVERSTKHADACYACPYFAICRNGCQRMRLFDCQQDTYHNYFCEAYRYFFDHCLNRMLAMARHIPSR